MSSQEIKNTAGESVKCLGARTVRRGFPLLVIGLTACATTYPLSMQKAEVLAQTWCTSIPFQNVSNCVRTQFDAGYPGWQRDRNADLVNIFLTWTDAAGKRVQSGTMTDAEAQASAQTLYQRLENIAYNRRMARQIDSQAAANLMLGGLALMELGQAQTVVAPAQPVYCKTTVFGQTYRTVCQ
jgi:hypothetical protein